MKKKQLVVGLVALALLAAIVIWGHDRMHFDFAAFRSQLALANWGKIGIGLACIYLGYVFRAVRWAWLLRHNKKVPLFSLVGTQVIGFTAVALIGRVADLGAVLTGGRAADHPRINGQPDQGENKIEKHDRGGKKIQAAAPAHVR